MKNIKLIKTYFLFVLVIILLINNINAQNLIPNPSFEEYSECPEDYAQTNFATGWTININSADYFNSCGESDFSVPDNYYGEQNAPHNNCNGYCGLYLYTFQVENHREYLGTELISPLIIGQRYYVSFKISLADVYKYAINNIGILFTNTSFEGINASNPFLSIWPAPLLNNFAHIYSEDVITDKVNWTTIRGLFIADSAYQQIIISNFFTDENTDVIQLYDGEYNSAYYYIDDVCVSTDSAFCWDYVYDCNSSFKDEIVYNTEFTLSPNPASDYVYFQLANDIFDKSKSVTLYTLQGENVTDKVEILGNGSNGITIKRNQLDAGVYVIRIQTLNNFYNAKLIFINNF